MKCLQLLAAATLSLGSMFTPMIAYSAPGVDMIYAGRRMSEQEARFIGYIEVDSKVALPIDVKYGFIRQGYLFCNQLKGLSRPEVQDVVGTYIMELQNGREDIRFLGESVLLSAVGSLCPEQQDVVEPMFEVDYNNIY